MDEYITNMKKHIRWNEKKKKGLRVSPFSICDEMLIYADRVVILRVLQKRVLKEFHMGHPGTSRMKSLMRSYVYWPRMDQNIQDMIKQYTGCQLAAKAPPIRTQPWPKTDVPWTRIHIDYAGPLKRYYYLVIVDRFSKWPEVYRYKHPAASNTIKALDEIFSRFGVVNTIVNDNATMFTGKEFKDYCDSLAIEHVTTPTYNPRSNGQEERFVDTFKRALRKNNGIDTEEKSLQKFLAVYMITPNQNTNANLSPAEIMFARKIRSVFDRMLPNKKKKKIYESKHKNYNV